VSALVENKAGCDGRNVGHVLCLLCRVFGSCGGQRRDAGVLEPVGAALEGDDVGMVDDPVDHCRGDDLVSEDVSPAGEDEVAGQDQRGVLVA